MSLFYIRALVRTALVVFCTITSFAASSEVLYNGPLVPLYELRGNAARVTYPELLVNEYRNSYYTTDPATRDLLLSRGWVGGDVFALVAGPQGTATTVPDVGTVKGLRRTFGVAPRSEHFYTTDQADVNVVVPRYGYVFEGHSGGLFTREIFDVSMIALNRIWKDWGAGKAEHRFIRGSSRRQAQPYYLSKQAYIDGQGYVDDRIEGYAVASDAISNVPQNWGQFITCGFSGDQAHCGLQVGDVVATQAVCAHGATACDEVLGTGMACGGIVNFYDDTTRELLATNSDFSYGRLSSPNDGYSNNGGSTNFGCRATVPNLPIAAFSLVRVEFSGFAVVFSTPDAAVTTQIVAPASYVINRDRVR